jgi:hypothetical protein
MIGVFLMLFGEKGGEKSVKNLLLPLPRTSRGRRRPTMPFKTALFWVFPFFLTVHETVSFWAKRVILFK